MNKDRFFILTSSEDGIDIRGPLDEDQLLSYLEGYERDYGSAPQFHSEIPDMDKGHFSEGPEYAMLIIKGEVVVPKPKTTVTKWRVD